MTGRLLYLLWEHQECGPEDLVATDDPAKVPDLFEQRLYWPKPEWPEYEQQFARAKAENDQAKAKLTAALAANEIGEVRLFAGWGGTYLQIVEMA